MDEIHRLYVAADVALDRKLEARAAGDVLRFRCYDNRHRDPDEETRAPQRKLRSRRRRPTSDGLGDDLRALQKQLTELDREEHRLLDAYQAGLVDLDQLRQRQERLRQRRAHVTGSIEVLHAERKTAQQQAQLQTDLETFVDTIRGPLATLDFDSRQQLVRTVLERVMVEDSRVDIHFAIPLPDPPPETTNPSVSTLFHLRSNGSDRRRQLPAPSRHTQPGVPRATGGATAIALIATWPPVAPLRPATSR